MPLHFPDPLDFDMLCRLTGLFGVLLYVTGFLLLSSGRIDSSRPGYFVLIFIAATCVMVSLCVDFNMSSALIQLFYMLMSVGGIVLRTRKKRRAAPVFSTESAR
ncbi:MAG: hypothetical protein AAF686_04905 [Pseudomonadota bacterium]